MSWHLDQTLETAAGAIRHGAAGDGPPLVLVHGTPWSSFSWHRVIPQLACHFRVHWYDLPGYGRSEMREGQRVSLDVQGEVFVQVLEHLKLDQPLVAGHDFGGAITLRAHLLHGVDYARYALLDVVALAPWGSPFFAHVRKHHEAFSGMPDYIHRAVVEAYIRGALGSGARDDDMDGLVSPWLTEQGQPAFYRQIAQADQKYTDEIEAGYGDIRCPVTVVWGEDDPWIPLATGRELHRRIPGSGFVPVSNAGHLVQLEAPERVASTLVAFLSGPEFHQSDSPGMAEN